MSNTLDTLKITFNNFIIILYKIFFLIIIIFIIKCTILDISKVSGISMEPNFKINELILINRIKYLFLQPKRYEVIQILDTEINEFIIKRIIGLPGESIIIKDNNVFVIDNNGQEQIVDKSYLPNSQETYSHLPNGIVKYKLDKREYFVLGDNRMNSLDSRHFGPINQSDIVGKVFYGLK